VLLTVVSNVWYVPTFIMFKFITDTCRSYRLIKRFTFMAIF